MESYKNTIAKNLIHGNWTASQHWAMCKISNAVDYAWNNWDEKILAKYYKGEKPEYPTAEFIYDWVEDEDFEADGFNVSYLKFTF